MMKVMEKIKMMKLMSSHLQQVRIENREKSPLKESHLKDQ